MNTGHSAPRLLRRTSRSLLFLTLAYPAWVGGGMHGFQVPTLWFGATALMASLCEAAARDFPDRRLFGEALGRAAVRLLRDPITWLGACFLILLICQWLNSGRTLIFDYQRDAWTFAPPPHPKLPSSVNPAEAAEMLFWFTPAFCAILAVRQTVRRTADVRPILLPLCLNATLISIAGLIRILARPTSGLPAPSMEGDSFAGFGYENHAGEYLLMILLLWIGLATDALSRRPQDKPRPSFIAGILASIVLTILAIHLSHCRASILLMWSALVVSAAWLLVFAGRHIRPSLRVNIAASILAAGILCFFIASSTNAERWNKEVQSLTRGTLIKANLDTRGWQFEAAWSMWKESPWFGVGGWGYRHMIGLHMDPERRELLSSAGRANVHNDALQFLTEFGIAGLGLLLATLGLLVRPLKLTRVLRNPLLFFPLLGAAITAAHSMIDLPFRSPAVLLLWLVVLTATSQCARATPESAPHRLRREQTRDNHGWHE